MIVIVYRIMCNSLLSICEKFVLMTACLCTQLTLTFNKICSWSKWRWACFTCMIRFHLWIIFPFLICCVCLLLCQAHTYWQHIPGGNTCSFLELRLLYMYKYGHVNFTQGKIFLIIYVWFYTVKIISWVLEWILLKMPVQENNTTFMICNCLQDKHNRNIYNSRFMIVLIFYLTH